MVILFPGYGTFIISIAFIEKILVFVFCGSKSQADFTLSEKMGSLCLYCACMCVCVSVLSPHSRVAGMMGGPTHTLEHLNYSGYVYSTKTSSHGVSGGSFHIAR